MVSVPIERIYQASLSADYNIVTSSRPMLGVANTCLLADLVISKEPNHTAEFYCVWLSTYGVGATQEGKSYPTDRFKRRRATSCRVERLVDYYWW
jgi:hypothetical protein